MKFTANGTEVDVGATGRLPQQLAISCTKKTLSELKVSVTTIRRWTEDDPRFEEGKNQVLALYTGCVSEVIIQE